MKNYNDITSIETEISAYRLGCICVKIDFEKRMVSWKDSHQWNNNFMRSLSDEQVRVCRAQLPGTHILEWQSQYNGPVLKEHSSLCHPADWTVLLTFTDTPSVHFSGTNLYPQDWQVFRNLVESVAKIPYRLR